MQLIQITDLVLRSTVAQEFYSPLCLATKRGDVDAVKLLVEQGDRSKINQLNSIDEESALFVAFRNQSLNILDILLQHPDINLNLSNRWGETALGLAVKGGDVKIVKRLLQDSKRVSNPKSGPPC